MCRHNFRSPEGTCLEDTFRVSGTPVWASGGSISTSRGSHFRPQRGSLGLPGPPRRPPDSGATDGGPFTQAKRRHPRCLFKKITLRGFKNTRHKVGHFSKGEHVAVRIGECEIAELRSNPSLDRKISPRSGHPSRQKCCINNEFFISRFTHPACGDRVAPLTITEPYRWWREEI